MFSVRLHLYRLVSDCGRSYTDLHVGTEYGVVPSARSFLSSASFRVLSILSMRLGFPFLLPSLQSLLPSGIRLPGPPHVQQCCYSLSNFRCGCILDFAFSLLLYLPTMFAQLMDCNTGRTLAKSSLLSLQLFLLSGSLLIHVLYWICIKTPAGFALQCRHTVHFIIFCDSHYYP